MLFPTRSKTNSVRVCRTTVMYIKEHLTTDQKVLAYLSKSGQAVSLRTASPKNRARQATPCLSRFCSASCSGRGSSRSGCILLCQVLVMTAIPSLPVMRPPPANRPGLICFICRPLRSRLLTWSSGGLLWLRASLRYTLPP